MNLYSDNALKLKRAIASGGLLALLMLLAACAPAELELDAAMIDVGVTETATVSGEAALASVATSTETPTRVADTAVPPTATAPNTATPIPTALPTEPMPTNTTEPLLTNTSEPTAEPTEPIPTDEVKTASAETITTVTPLPATQLPPSPIPPTQSSKRAAPNIPSSLDDLMNQILDDAAAQSGVSRDVIYVITVEEVTWRDGSIGCPQPDMMYTQALVGGFRILLNAESRTMPYHTNGTRGFVYCNPDKAKPEQPLPPGSGGASDDT